MTLSEGDDRLDYNVFLISAASLRGRAADDRIVMRDGTSIIPFPRLIVNHVYTTE
jgi:hypothetical protein